MPPEPILRFGAYRLDAVNARLWCEHDPVHLTAKALQVLKHLAERPGQLVTKEELFAAVWPDTVVSDATLTSNIQAIRQALKDDSRQPQFIETVHRQGFRFIGTVVSDQLSVVSREEVISSQPSIDSSEEKPTSERQGSSVMPAQPVPGSPRGARIQAAQPEALSESPWIPASAGMTPVDEARDSEGETSAVNPRPPLRSLRTRGLVVVSLGLLVSIVLAVQYFSLRTSSTQSPTLNPQSLPLPDKPSIIVLPLVNLSGDPEQEYFSDGLTEVLTGDLSRIASLFVIARNSAFTYKGKATKVQDISREMGVRYVLEGSVQKANQRIRIAMQLIDATTGYHMWSEQYDRLLTDIFALQDEIVQKIATTLKLQLTVREQGWIIHKHTNNLEAYDYFLRGVEYYNRFTKETNVQARQMYEHAIALDPQYAEAYEWLDVTYVIEWLFGWSMDPQTLTRALELAQKATALDDSLPTPHWGLSEIYAVTQKYEQAIAEGERAIALDPNNADSYHVLTIAFGYAGRPEEALKTMAQAMRLNPRPPAEYLVVLGWVYVEAGRYNEAITTLQDAITQSPSYVPAYLNLAVGYLFQWLAQQGTADLTLDPAKAEVQRALDLSESLPRNHIVLGLVDLYQRQYDQALAEIERGLALVPNEALGRAALALVLSCEGRSPEALEAAAQALRLKSLVDDDHLADVGSAYAIAGRYQEARDPLQRYLRHYPNILHAHLMLAAVYSELGQTAEAQKEAAEVLRLNPNFSLAVHKQRMPIKDPAVLERHIAALRKAGLK